MPLGHQLQAYNGFPFSGFNPNRYNLPMNTYQRGLYANPTLNESLLEQLKMNRLKDSIAYNNRAAAALEYLKLKSSHQMVLSNLLFRKNNTEPIVIEDDKEEFMEKPMQYPAQSQTKIDVPSFQDVVNTQRGNLELKTISKKILNKKVNFCSSLFFF